MARKLYKSSVLCLFIAFLFGCYSGTDVYCVSGVVVDSVSGSPIADASVYVDLGIYSTTNVDGQYMLYVSKEEAFRTLQIRVSACGYREGGTSLYVDDSFKCTDEVSAIALDGDVGEESKVVSKWYFPAVTERVRTDYGVRIVCREPARAVFLFNCPLVVDPLNYPVGNSLTYSERCIGEEGGYNPSGFLYGNAVVFTCRDDFSDGSCGRMRRGCL